MYTQPYVLVRNLDRADIPPIKARVCATFACRLRGLTFRRSLGMEEGLLLIEKRDSRLETGIHMLGVCMDLTIAWINSRYEVVDTRFAQRWRPVYLPKRPARFILEMSSAHRDDFRVGEKVSIEEIAVD